MGHSPAQLEIRQSGSSNDLRLTVHGALDVATAPILEARLRRLRASRSPVRLDLSRLAFIDSSGIFLLVRMVRDAEIGHWQLRIDPEVNPEVMRVMKLMHVGRILSRGDTAAA